MSHHTGAGESSAEGADEVERVHLDVLAAVSLAERAAGGTCQVKRKRLSVELCPLPNDVGDQAPVVGGVKLHGAADNRVDVDAVRPDVAGCLLYTSDAADE